MIATKFCTWHDSCAVVACAKFCCDMITSNWITAKGNFHKIWNVTEMSLVKRVPVKNKNSLWPIDNIWLQWIWSPLVQVVTRSIFGSKSFPRPILTYLSSVEPKGIQFRHFNQNTTTYYQDNSFENVALFKNKIFILSPRKYPSVSEIAYNYFICPVANLTGWAQFSSFQHWFCIQNGSHFGQAWRS